MEKTNLYNQELLEIFSISNNGLLPTFYNDFELNKPLFIGINPSFSIRGFKQILKGEIDFGMLQDIQGYFKYCPLKLGDNKINEIQQMEKLAVKKYKYFAKIRELSADSDFQHLDLFSIRETTQKKIVEFINSQQEWKNRHLALSKNIISEISPSYIVICNAFASRLFKEYWDKSICWNEDLGVYLLDDRIPVFLSGILSGGRALDLGSFQRLKWHIGYVTSRLKE